jgi:hypothetical protein
MSYTLTGIDIDNLSNFVVEANDVFVIRARGGVGYRGDMVYILRWPYTCAGGVSSMNILFLSNTMASLFVVGVEREGGARTLVLWKTCLQESFQRSGIIFQARGFLSDPYYTPG